MLSGPPPVLFLVFNRPEPTAQVFQAIRQARPTRLYVAADGPRTHKDEAAACDTVRQIATEVDWPCEVRTLFRTENLGCRRAVSDAITWFFSNEEEGIILEDDCLPNESFFRFTASMLERYRHNSHVMSISGSCFYTPLWRKADYTFTYYADMWGWATWRRAWEHYDANMEGWRSNPTRLDTNFRRDEPREYWTWYFNETADGRIDTWDYQWIWTLIAHRALSVTPLINMVRNIGFGEGATHTKDAEWTIQNRPLRNLGAKIRHPKLIRRDESVERYIEVCRLSVSRRRLLDKITGKVRRAIANYTTYDGKL